MQKEQSIIMTSAFLLFSALFAFSNSSFAFPVYWSDLSATLGRETHSLPSANDFARLRKGMKMQFDANHPQVQKFVRAYAKNPKVIYQSLERAKPYFHIILDKIEDQNLPTELALLPIVESNYSATVRSHMGALGLWQIMPGTAKFLGLKTSTQYDGRKDILASTDAALYYLQYFQGKFNNWLLSLASYNAGEGNVRKAIRRSPTQSHDFYSLRLPKETQNYVPQLLALAVIFKNPEAYGIKLPDFSKETRATAVEVPPHLSPLQVQALSKTPQKVFQKLNPAFTQNTKLKEPYFLLLPAQNASLFTKNNKA